MNAQAKPLPATHKPLSGRVSLVTGSTSGIGLGIARALAQAGSDIVLNGLGGSAEAAEIQASLQAEHGVKAL